MLKFSDIFSSLIRAKFTGIFGIDLAILITATALQAFCIYVITPNSEVLFSFGIMISWSLFSVLLIGLTVAWWALVGGIIISWVAPVSSFPPSRLLLQMSNQICKPFRLFLPPIGGLDFSPILAFLILQFLWGAVYGLSTGAGLPMYLSMGS